IESRGGRRRDGPDPIARARPRAPGRRPRPPPSARMWRWTTLRLVAAAIQMPAEPRQVAANLDRADALLRRARDAGAELAVLPEMFNTGYGKMADYGPYAEGRDGPTLGHLRR